MNKVNSLKNKLRKSRLGTFILISTLACMPLQGCGGGGGGDGGGFIGAATLSVQAEPHTIDTGDRTQVTIQIRDIHPNGILLKVRFPKGLAYVPNTSFLEVDDNQVDVGPDKNVTKDSKTFLVFFLDPSDFTPEESGSLTFQLVGNEAVTDGLLEVDADVNDPLVNDDNEFSANTPEFGAEDSVDVEVTN
ncbi:MAG: hypothetical protein K1X79_13185 [Oligoflexia bacterium]|nr:hypothetical protein [Oligoflexia bacterium]